MEYYKRKGEKIMKKMKITIICDGCENQTSIITDKTGNFISLGKDTLQKITIKSVDRYGNNQLESKIICNQCRSSVFLNEYIEQITNNVQVQKENVQE